MIELLKMPNAKQNLLEKITKTEIVRYWLAKNEKTDRVRFKYITR